MQNQNQPIQPSERQVLVARISELRRQHAKALLDLEKQRDAAAVRLETARAAFEDASRGFNLAAGAAVNASFAHDSAVGKLEQALRDTADPTIHLFVDEMDALYVRETREPATTERDVQRSAREGFVHVHIMSDRPSRVRRLSAIRAAQLEARDIVVLEAHDPESLASRLKGLRSTLPAIAIEPLASAA